jgi:hypothetical protein
MVKDIWGRTKLSVRYTRRTSQESAVLSTYKAVLGLEIKVLRGAGNPPLTLKPLFLPPKTPF